MYISLYLYGKNKYMNENYTDINSKTIDKWVEKGWEWGMPISREAYTLDIVKADMTRKLPFPDESFHLNKRHL